MLGSITKISAIIIMLTGCANQKHIVKDKSVTRQSGIIIREIPGDSITVVRDTIYRDTVIVSRTKFLNLTETYGNGTVRIKCKQKHIKENEKYEKEIKANIKEKTKETQGFKDVYFLYVGLILIIMVIINKLLK